MSSPSKKVAVRQAEMALLKHLSTSLETYNEDKRSDDKKEQALDNFRKTWPRPVKRYSGGDASKAATKSFLEVKTLVKGMVKACIQEKVATTETEDGSMRVLDSLVEEFRSNGFPSVNRQRVLDGIARYKQTQETNDENNNEGTKTPEEEEEEDDGDVSDEMKLERCIQMVNDGMDEYYERILALKEKRERAALDPISAEPTTKISPKKRKSMDGENNADGTSPKKRGRPKGKATAATKRTPLTLMVDDLTERYVKLRKNADRLASGDFEKLVEECKKDHGLEDIDVPLEKIRKRVTWNYLRHPEKEISKAHKQKKDLVDEIYLRYTRAKETNGSKLLNSTLISIIEGVKLEFGVSDVNMKAIASKVQVRFKKEFPDFRSLPEGVCELSKLSEEDKHRRQTLLNEIMRRYVQLKGKGKKRLPDGTMDRIIEQTRNDLGIFDFEVSLIV